MMKWVKRAARRVRVRSIILSSHRKRPAQWGEWLRWEVAKPFLPFLVLIPLQMIVIELPNLLWAALLIACVARIIFVLANAGVVAMRLNSRRTAFLKRVGYDLSASSLLADKDAWRGSLSGGTMRDLLKTRSR